MDKRMRTKLDRIAEKARTDGKLRFTALAHVITPDFLMETWKQMNRRGASGVDQETMTEYASNLEGRCQDLVARLKARRYKAPPVRRVEIPKGDGKTRPLGIPTVEDRLLQRAVARILSAIYEQDFLPCSYGFRPGRNPHQALAALRDRAMAGRARCVFETDIRGFFNHLDHGWLMRMLKLRIGDPEILRLVAKWLRAGVFAGGVVVETKEGSPQGGPISPLLANIYLHYALDLWFEKRFLRQCRGKTNLIRFADDFVAAFEFPEEAMRFEREVRARLAEFNLELAAEKTRQVPFGRYARTHQRGQRCTFDFLGFKHLGGRDLKGRYAVLRIPTTKSCRKFLDSVKTWLAKNMHTNRVDQQKHLTRMLRGFYQYFGLNQCMEKLRLIRLYVVRLWVKTLRRQSQRHKYSWQNLNGRSWFNLPMPLVVHPAV
jgi:group II intron reverse transcriptase/maturase